MNVFEKLATARVEFQKLNKKMSGKNKFAGYEYYELADILPEINKLGKELGFVCEVSFTDVAELIFRNTEKPDETIKFTSPMSTASLKGCHDVQNLGAVQTYIKRYLYQNCFEIVEADSLNATQVLSKLSEAPKPSDAPKISESQKRCTELGDKLGITPAERKRLYEESGRSFDKLQVLLEAREAAEAKEAENKKNMEIF